MTPRAAPVGEPWLVAPDSPAIADILALIRTAFAPMQGRIDPPSSAGRLDAGAIRAQAETGEVWAIGAPPVGCVFLTPQAGGLYLGKLAVDPSQRRGGLGRRLLAQAETRARALGLARLDLKTRVELVENHAFFTAAGFRQVASQAHPGYARVTTLVFSKEVGA